MYRIVVVALLLAVLTIRAIGQPDADTPRLPVSQQSVPAYEMETTEDLLDSALSSVPGSSELRASKSDHEQLVKVYMRLARTFDNNGNLSGARDALERMKRELAYVDDPRSSAAYHMQLGLLDYSEDQFDEAVRNLQNALDMYGVLKDTVLMASCYLNLGNAYRELEDEVKAIQNYNAALYIYEMNGDDASAALALGYVGNIYKERGEEELALSNYYKSLALHRKNDFREDILIDLNNIGEVMIAAGDYNEAVPYLMESLSISRDIDSQTGIIAATYNLAVVDIANGDNSFALTKFEDVLRRARAVNSASDIRNANRRLAEVYERSGRLEQALFYRKQYDAWKDSVIVQTDRDKQFRREAARKTRQAQITSTEKQLTDKELSRQHTLRNAVIIVIILVGLITAGTVYLLRQRAWSKNTIHDTSSSLSDISARYEQLQMQLAMIRTQLNPHFLYNSMESVARLILAGDNKNASLYLSKLSRLLKLSLENLENGRVSLDSELMQIESYVQMEQLRMDEKVNFEINVDRLADGDDVMMPPMILQPFVENALWHGLAHKGEGESRHLRIHVKEKREAVICTIEDNGVGRERAEQLSGHHTKGKEQAGIRLAEQRLRMLDRNGNGSLIRILDLKDRYGNAVGTRVEVLIPVSKAR
ncbi:tetratricopeptide repeat protein [Chryseolinea sp. T2]|uniref:tetratricopeptide repeat-containing sensor histidine kinase n=1 Tax=Chryseolinea sp. T2 TaxID=3129255 RepID=UPI00307851C2